MSKSLVHLGLGALLLTAACGKSEPAPAQQSAPLAQPAAAVVPLQSPQEVYATRCVPCHGSSGSGDGPAAVALTPKPRNYKDAEWQKGVTDEQLKKTILYGGAAVGKSAAMPSQPDLEGRPEVLDGLIKIIRGFGAT